MLFRGGAEVADRTLPFSQFDSKNPEDLWSWMQDVEARTGSDLLAIPHNGNLSNGRMLSVESFDGAPLTEELAARRIRFEPLIEVTQIKGDGESDVSPFVARLPRDISACVTARLLSDQAFVAEALSHDQGSMQLCFGRNPG